jgi:hypothetical protein
MMDHEPDIVKNNMLKDNNMSDASVAGTESHPSINDVPWGFFSNVGAAWP